jgi:hypothetical protein
MTVGFEYLFDILLQETIRPQALALFPVTAVIGNFNDLYVHNLNP